MLIDRENPPKAVEFNGKVFALMGGRRKYYLEKGKQKAGQRPVGLHVAIWEDAFGVVPPNHEINHKNGDTFDCRLDNLECLQKTIHRKLPKRIDPKKLKSALEAARKAAVHWHKSPEGRRWHMANAKTSIHKAVDAAKLINTQFKGEKLCEHCGIKMPFKNPRKRFCSAAHQTAAYRSVH